MRKRKLNKICNNTEMKRFKIYKVYKNLTSRRKNKVSRTKVFNQQYLPQDIYKEIFEYLSFKDLASVSLVCKQWRQISEQIKTYDIVLACDITGSVSYYQLLMVCLKMWRPILINQRVRLGFVGYRDHQRYSNDLYKDLIESRTLTTPRKTINFMSKIRCVGGDDVCEAVLDGLNDAMLMDWKRSAKKHLILFCDAPPHGKQFGCRGDYFPKGCPCGLDEEDILNSIGQKGINLWMVTPDSDMLDRTSLIFKNILPQLTWEKASLRDFLLVTNQIFETILSTENQALKKLIHSIDEYQILHQNLARTFNRLPRSSIKKCIENDWDETSKSNLIAWIRKYN